MADEIEDALRERLGRRTRLALYAAVIALGVVLTWLRWGGVLDIQRGLLFGPVVVLIGVLLLGRDLLRR